MEQIAEISALRDVVHTQHPQHDAFMAPDVVASAGLFSAGGSTHINCLQSQCCQLGTVSVARSRGSFDDIVDNGVNLVFPSRLGTAERGVRIYETQASYAGIERNATIQAILSSAGPSVHGYT